MEKHSMEYCFVKEVKSALNLLQLQHSDIE